MKIVFLDIDGVLNNEWCMHCQERLDIPNYMDERCVFYLKYALDAIPNVKVVVSSSWREQNFDTFLELLKTRQSLKTFEPLIKYLHKDYCTPNLFKKRGYEINAWLCEHKGEVDKFICIDDDTDFFPSQPLLQTNVITGFGYIEMSLLMRYFNASNDNLSVESFKKQCISYMEKNKKILAHNLKFIDEHIIL